MTRPDEAKQQRSRVHELARMSRTQLITIYQSLRSEHQADFAVVGWDRDQLITAIRDREDGQLGVSQPEPDGARLFSHPAQESIDG